MELSRVGFVLLMAVSLASSQVLNGFINPMWMADRRTGRYRNDYLSGSLSQQQQLPYYQSNLVYMDDSGRYYPVYRQDRLYRADQVPQYYRVGGDQQRTLGIADQQLLTTTLN